MMVIIITMLQLYIPERATRFLGCVSYKSHIARVTDMTKHQKTKPNPLQCLYRILSL